MDLLREPSAAILHPSPDHQVDEGASGQPEDHPPAAEGAEMTDDEIGELVRKGLSAGTLPKQSIGIASDVSAGGPGGSPKILADLGSSFPEPCAVCGGRPTQVRYDVPAWPGGSIAFHGRCHGVWMEEIGRL